MLGLILILFAAILNTDEPAKTRSERIDALFSPIDGSFEPLVQQTKRELLDPESIEPVRTKYIDNGTNVIQVEMIFRAKNAYGIAVPGRAVGTMDSTGVLLHFNIENYEQ
jgi:hypothetical protein